MFEVNDNKTGKNKIPSVPSADKDMDSDDIDHDIYKNGFNGSPDEDMKGETIDTDNDGGEENYTEHDDNGDEDEQGDELDSEQMEDFHGLMMGHYINELGRQAENRAQMATDEDYYDSIQWSEEDAQVLKDRGQAPIVYNVISQSVNWVIGSEKRGRSDFKILPRTKEDAKPAERKTQILKYLSDVNKTQFNSSRAFEDTTKVGIGWIEDGIQDDPDEEVIYSSYENWRNILWDSSSTEYDLSDARYLFRSKWVDLDISKAMFKKRSGLLDDSVAESLFGDINGDLAMDMQELETTNTTSSLGDGGNASSRKRVRLIEVWFKAPVTEERINGGSFHGEEFDDENQSMVDEVQQGLAIVKSRLRMRMHVAVMTASGLLYYGKSPYKHNKFPFTPIWGYRRGRDSLPYGLIRSVRDMQDDINKRASKAQYILSTNKVIMDDDAVEDMENFLDEVARPDGVIRKKKGSHLEINADRELGGAHLELMSRSIGMIQQASGVTDELLGRTTNAVSGVAVQKRQEQGSLATSKLFDNLRYAKQQQGEKQLSMIEQFMTEKKTVRVTNQRGIPQYIDVNDGMPENDIVSSKADFIISEADWRANMQQAQVEALVGMLPSLPQEVAMAILDLVVDTMDISNKEEIVERIRAINGQTDPDKDEESEEAKATAEAKAAQAQEQAEALQMQKDITLSNIENTKAKTEKLNSEIRSEEAKTVTESIKQQEIATGAAAQILQMPGIAGIADVLLQESGFIGDTEKGEAIEAMNQEDMMQQQAMQQQQRQAIIKENGLNGMQGQEPEQLPPPQ